MVEKPLYCEGSLGDEKCDLCENNYFFDEDNNCVSTKFLKKGDATGKCIECIDGYYLSRKGNICTKTEKCYSGINSEGTRRKRVSGYYRIFFFLFLNRFKKHKLKKC